MPIPAWVPLLSNPRGLAVYAALLPTLVLLTLILQPLQSDLGPALLVPYLLVVALAARFGGIGAAIFASLATVPLVDFFLFGTPGRIELETRQVSQLVLVLLAGILLGWLLDRLRAERARAEAAVAAACAAIVERDALLSVIAHDLRSPLAAVKARAQLAGLSLRRDQPDVASATRSIEAALPQVDRISRLLDDLLATGRTDGRTLEVQPVPMDAAPLLERVAERWRDDAPSHSIVLESAEPLPVDGDAVRIEQMLDNLIANAVKYSPHGSTIRLRAVSLDGEARLSVSDQGAGIPPDELPYLFDRFYRRPEHRVGRQPGIGLGLFIARELVAAHGGRISVESTPGQGSTFHVTLPLRSPNPEPPRPA